MTKKGFRLVSVLYFLALIALSFSVYSFFQSATFAWFGKNDDVSVQGLRLGAYDDHRGNVTLTAYKYDLDSMKGVECEKVEGAYRLELNQYDTIFNQLNVYNPLLLRFHIVLGNFSRFSIDLTHDTSKDGSEKSRLSKYLSSVVTVKAAIFEGKDALDDSSADTLWRAASDAFKNVSDAQQYVSVNEGADETTFQKAPSLTFTFNHASSSEGFDVYFWIDYSPSLVTSYINAGGEADGGEGGTLSGVGTYTMENDIVTAQANFQEAA